MSRYKLSPMARLDLQEIWLFTFTTWSENQANTYQKSLTKTFELIVSEPEIGISIDFIRKGYRRFQFKSHYIYYRVEEGQLIVIIRILHFRMNQIKIAE